MDDYEFDHDFPTDKGSSGCPILLLNNNMNSIQVIGVHKGANYSKQLNIGTFIWEILNDELNLIKRENNYIIAEIFIKDEDVNKNIWIINSFEEYIKYKNLENKSGRFKNEDQINKM